MKHITEFEIEGAIYKVIGMVTGESYDKKSGYGYYVCRHGSRPEVLVPFDAGMDPYPSILEPRGVVVTTEAVKEVNS